MSLFRKKEDTERDFYGQCFVDYQRKTHESIKYLAKENEELKEELKNANDTLDTHNELIKYLQNRIDKAIEYIENDLSHVKVVGKRNKSYLVEILKGED